MGILRRNRAPRDPWTNARKIYATCVDRGILAKELLHRRLVDFKWPMPPRPYIEPYVYIPESDLSVREVTQSFVNFGLEVEYRGDGRYVLLNPGEHVQPA